MSAVDDLKIKITEGNKKINDLQSELNAANNEHQKLQENLKIITQMKSQLKLLEDREDVLKKQLSSVELENQRIKEEIGGHDGAYTTAFINSKPASNSSSHHRTANS